MSRKTIEVDSDMIDHSLEELSKLIIRLENNPKKTRKDQNSIKKIPDIQNTIQDSVLYAKLKKKRTVMVDILDYICKRFKISAFAAYICSF